MAAFCGSLNWRAAPEDLSGIASRHRGFGTLTFDHDRHHHLAWAAKRSDLDHLVLRKHDGVTAIGQFSHADDASSFARVVEAWVGGHGLTLTSLGHDFAVAVLDDRSRTVHLARAPLSSIPLAYRCKSGSTVFASLASALHNGGEVDLDFLARLYGSEPVYGSAQTAFRNVRLVLPGTLVSISADGTTDIRRFWSAGERERLTDADAADLLRSSFDEAMRCAVAGYEGRVATHLSGGRDSGLVTATAAMALAREGRRPLALTAAPHPHAGVIYSAKEDEEEAARAVVLRYPSIDHRVLRVSKIDLGALLDRHHQARHAPHQAPLNLPWWDRSLAVAAEEGCNLLLTGVSGNLTLSAGGPEAIVDLLGSGNLRAWLNAIRRASEWPASTYTSLLFQSIAPWLPVPAVRALRKIAARPPLSARSPFLGRYLNEHLSAETALRPPKSWADTLHRALNDSDDGDPNSMLLHGLSVRDPTADKAVVEAVLRISPEALASPWNERPIYERAFADRLPMKTLRPTVRGLQAADWNNAIDHQKLLASVEVYSQSRMVRELLDIASIKAALRQWPEGRVDDPVKGFLYPYRLLPAVSLASFLHLHFPD